VHVGSGRARITHLCGSYPTSELGDWIVSQLPKIIGRTRVRQTVVLHFEFAETRH
jgi:hypothetical protein